MRQYQLILQHNQYQLSFFCRNCSSKSYSSLTCRGWINSNTCSHREDIPIEWRRRLSRCSTNHGAVVFCCFSLEKKQKKQHLLILFSIEKWSYILCYLYRREYTSFDFGLELYKILDGQFDEMFDQSTSDSPSLVQN